MDQPAPRNANPLRTATGIRQRRQRQHLQGDEPIELEVSRQEHGAHRAAPDLFPYLVAGHRGSDGARPPGDLTSEPDDLLDLLAQVAPVARVFVDGSLTALTQIGDHRLEDEIEKGFVVGRGGGSGHGALRGAIRKLTEKLHRRLPRSLPVIRSATGPWAMTSHRGDAACFEVRDVAIRRRAGGRQWEQHEADRR